MDGPRLLVVEDDPDLRAVIDSVFSMQNYDVVSTANGCEALREALKTPPDVVISDVVMPEMDGWVLVKQFRSHARLAFIPFIFLSDLNTAEDRVRGFRLGADDFLPKPFHFEELEFRVRGALRRSKHVPKDFRKTGEDAATCLTGTLDQVGLPSMLAFLELERKTGLLEVIPSHNPMTASIYLNDGRIVHAVLVDEDELTGKDAVYAALAWTAGQFAFEACKVNVQATVSATTTHLLMESARRIDEEDWAVLG
ncbi:MAG: response regulator [Nannocystaceae bacterium]